MALRAVLHRLGVAVSVDVTILLMEAANPVASVNAHLRHLTAEHAAAKRGLAQMRADAALLQRRMVQYQTEAATWQARAEWALQASDPRLARLALARKLHVQRVAEQYADQQTAQQRSLASIHAAVAQLEAHIGEVQSLHAQARRIHTDHDMPRQAYAVLAELDHETVESQFATFELDQAMDDLRRTVHDR